MILLVSEGLTTQAHAPTLLPKATTVLGVQARWATTSAQRKKPTRIRGTATFWVKSQVTELVAFFGVQARRARRLLVKALVPLVAWSIGVQAPWTTAKTAAPATSTTWARGTGMAGLARRVAWRSCSQQGGARELPRERPGTLPSTTSSHRDAVHRMLEAKGTMCAGAGSLTGPAARTSTM